MLTVSAQGVGPLFCMVQERTIEVSVLSHDPYTEMLDLAHFGLSSDRQTPTQGFIHVKKTQANHCLAIPLALNFIASCECTRIFLALIGSSGSNVPCAKLQRAMHQLGNEGWQIRCEMVN